jgi:hypothetical protein
MKRKEFTKRLYLKPFATVCSVSNEHLMLFASGQHTPIGQDGGSFGDAKRGQISLDDEEEEDAVEGTSTWVTFNVWDD